MTKSAIPSPSDPNPNSNSFESLTNATTELTKNSSDSVAIAAIVGLVLSFITLVIIGGCVIYVTN